MTPDRQTIVEVQYLRAIAVLLVFFGHAHQNEARFFSDTAFGDYMFFGFSGVDVFFVISGFIIHTLYKHREGLDPVFYLQRLNRIFPMYWLFTLGAILGYTLVLGGQFSQVTQNTDWLRTLTLWPGDDMPLLPVAWTLTHELYFYLAYAVFLAAPMRWRPYLVAVWFAITCIGLAIPDHAEHPVVRLIISPFNFLFLAGALMAEFRARIEGMKLVAAILCLAGLVLGLAYCTTYGVSGLQDAAIRVAVFAPFAIGVSGLLLSWRPVWPDAFVRIGDWSYVLYLGHTLVLDVSARLLARFIDGSVLASPVYYFSGLVAVLIMAGIAHHLFERPALRLGKQLISGLPRR